MSGQDDTEENPLVKIFECARRFESDCEFVELYWDKIPTHKFRNQVVKTYLKRVEGYRQTRINSYYIDKQTSPNSSLLINAPIVSDHYYKDINKAMKTIVKQLRRRKMKEVKKFHKAHKLSVPCFTWVVSDEEEDKTSPDYPITSSRVGGLPALLPDEPWPNMKMQFLYQINLSTIPKRLQLILGTEGLLQLFWEIESGGGEGLARIIPAKSFESLVMAGQTNEQQGPKAELITAGSPKLGLITGWIERNDYCPRLVEAGKDEALDSLLDDLRIGVDKFGGYSGEEPEPGQISTQFHAFPSYMLRMDDVCDCQAICVSYDPKDIHTLERGQRHLEAFAYTSDF